VGFEIGTIGFFSLKQKKLAFGIYAEGFLKSFCYCEKRKRIFGQIGPSTLRVWNFTGDKPIMEKDIKLKSQSQGPFYTILYDDVLYCCGGGNEIIAYSLEKNQQEKIKLEDFETDGLFPLRESHRMLATSSVKSSLCVLKLKN